MPEDIKRKVVDYLSDHHKMTLATATSDGRPLAHTVEYASDGATVYFLTTKGTRKTVNIARNPRVAYAVDQEYEDLAAIRGVQMENRATVLSDPRDVKRATDVYLKKFPQFAAFLPSTTMVFVRLDPVAGFFLDYTKGFEHRDAVKY